MKKILALSFMLILLTSCGNNINDNKIGNPVNNIEIEDNIPVELTTEEEQVINEILEF